MFHLPFALVLSSVSVMLGGCQKAEMSEITKFRSPEFAVDELFVSRWSPRAMSGAKITSQELMSLLEAARWAPSAYNDQPWRFVYVMRETPEWKPVFDCLVDWNKMWCKNAGALVVFTARTTFERGGKPNGTAVFDTGAAWENFALQGHLNGLVVHGMSGFDYEKMAKVINLPAGYEIVAMAAVGKPAPKTVLPEEMQSGEVPSSRKALKELTFEGKFKN